MTDWVDVAAENSFVQGEKVKIDLDDVTQVVVVKLGDGFYAIENMCSHDQLPLGEGDIEGDEIICPFHNARFCLKTGELRAPPAYENIASFPTRVENGQVQVRDDRWD